MKILILVIAFYSFNSFAESTVKVCVGEYALCAASPTIKTGKVMYVGDVAFDEGVSVCPVLTGASLADMSLMGGSCDAPEGQVWSLFSPQSEFPQAPTWEVKPAAIRTFVTTDKKGGGMSNMWSFPCVVRKHRINGVKLADCHGPMNESPKNSQPIGVGISIITQAPEGALNPVGGDLK